MAKVQGKKRAAAGRRTAAKVGARVKSTARAIKKKVAARRPAAPAKSAKKPAPKPASKVTKAVRRAAAPLPAKPAAVAPAHAKGPVARHVLPVPAAEAAKKPRTRRVRPRVHSNGAPVAAWLPQGSEKPRPSSFIPAPARAAAPSLSAAPPASSDRLIRPEDVTEFVTRTVPIRVDVEQSGGRVFISVNPEEVSLRSGEGVEWDFRYLGGTDVTVDEVMIDFEKPSPFSSTTFRSRKPGTARPHRQISGAVQKSAVGKRVAYTIRAINGFKTELAKRTLILNVMP